jgi:hypothetical protein
MGASLITTGRGRADENEDANREKALTERD